MGGEGGVLSKAIWVQFASKHVDNSEGFLYLCSLFFTVKKNVTASLSDFSVLSVQSSWLNFETNNNAKLGGNVLVPYLMQSLYCQALFFSHYV